MAFAVPTEPSWYTPLGCYSVFSHTHTHIHTRICQLPLLNKLFAQSPFSPTLIYRNRQVDSGKKKTSEETEQIYRVSLNLRISTKSTATKKQKERMKETETELSFPAGLLAASLRYYHCLGKVREQTHGR